MSFLDRFQNKIATVTAHGHLKKADGSEEIRVGPPKRRPNPQQGSTSATERSSNAPVRGGGRGNNNLPEPAHAQPSGKGRGVTIVPPLGQLPRADGGGHGLLCKNNTDKGTGANSARQSHPSPNASPRSKSGRDGYDYGGAYENNNHAHHHQQSHRSHPQSFDNHHLPGRANDDYGYYDDTHQFSYGKRGSPSKQGASPDRSYKYNDPYNHTEQSRNRSPVPNSSRDEHPSPRERNEARVQTDEDQLAFSRKARPVQFAPCTLSQYKKEKPSGYYELGKLQPDLNSDELVQKRANAERIKAFSKNLREINKSITAVKKHDEDEATSQKKANSTREKALAFAKHIPRPKLQQRPLAEPSGALSNSSSSESMPGVNKLTRPINQIVDDDDDDNTVSSELQQLQMRHQASRAQVEALIRNN